jgi:WD40 repeat protein/serine/threonine protein kinase
MPEPSPVDDSLLRRLPLPLAQLYRRAHNAKTPLERHLAAYYLWEAGLKLLASVAVVEYAERGPAAPDIAERLRNLARPALGHWWEIARLLIAAQADAGNAAFVHLRDVLLGKPRNDCPRAAGLDAVLREVLEGKAGARATVQLAELFHRLVSLRNDEVGHGAAGQRPPAYYERTAPALLAGVAEMLDRLDVLAGRRLIHVADVRRLGSGNWLVERYDLSTGAVYRIESLEIPQAEAARLPHPGRLYVTGPGESIDWRMLHPLLVFDADAEQVYFLNARVRQRRAEYLCYTTGGIVKRDELGQEQRELLAKVLGGPVDAAAVEAWAEQSRADDPPPPPGEPTRRTIGEFELVSRLGRGGMGVVYRAWQPSLGRQVALKCLLRSGDPKAEARFAREIHALGKVDHPHLVKVFTSGADGDQWFYAMELVEGADLAAVCTHLTGSKAAAVSEADWQAAVSTVCERQRRQEQPLDALPASEAPVPVSAPEAPSSRPGRAYVARVVEVMRQVAEAAHALHEAGVIHRDVKPGNVMLSADGTHAVLLDLGLAQLCDEEEGRLTKTRQFVGTLRYASPEQLLAAKLDPRADVYSLGATLWELLTLRPLYGVTDQTPTPEAMLKIQTSEPEHVRKHNPQVPADLGAIVMKCLEKDRARRYGSAAELAADLGRWQRGEAVLAQPPSLRYLLGKQLWRWRVPLAVAAGVLLAAVVGVVIAFVQINDALRQKKDALEDVVAKEKATDEANRKLREVNAKQKTLLIEGARTYSELSDREFKQGKVRDSMNWMLRAYETAPLEDKRRLNYLRLIALQSQTKGRPLLLEPATAAAFSPDRRTVLTANSWHNTASLWDIVSGKEIATFRHTDSVEAVAFGPDGRTVLTGGWDKTARVWDVASGKELATLPHAEWVEAVAFSPDGGTVLTGCRDKTARLWEVASGKEIATFHTDWVQAVAFSPDGHTVLTDGGGTAHLWDVASGKEIASVRHETWVGGGVSGPELAFSPDGRTFSDGRTLWDVASGRKIATLPHKESVKTVAFSPDGRIVLTGSEEIARLWDIVSREEIASLRHKGWVTAVAFSPDGCTTLTWGDDGMWLWDIAFGKEIATLRHEGSVKAVAFSPDGRTALAGGNDGTRLWDVSSGKELPLLRHEGSVTAVAFSPDGRTVLTGGYEGTRLWDVSSGKELPLLRHEKLVTAVAFSTDSHTVLTGSDDSTARLWDIATGKEIATFRHPDWVKAVAFSPNGSTVLTGCWDKTARLWDIATGKEITTFRHEESVIAVAFSPDGRIALTGGRDRMARLWDIATGKEIATLPHEGSVTAVAFSPDGGTALTGSEDKTAKLWDVASGRLLATLRHEGSVVAVAFSPDGHVALTGSGGNAAARLWRLPQWAPDEPDRVRAWVRVRTARAFSEQGSLRDLTRDEWLEQCRQLDALGGDWEKPLDARSWHPFQAAEAEAGNHWFAAAFHLRRLLAVEPSNTEYLDRLGVATYRDGKHAEAVERLSDLIQKHGKGGTSALRLLLAMAQYRVAQQNAAAMLAGLSAASPTGFVPLSPTLLAQQPLARQQLAQTLRQIESTRDPDSEKDKDRWDALRQEAQTILKPPNP